MRICNLGSKKICKLCNIGSGLLISLVDSMLNVKPEYYLTAQNKDDQSDSQRVLINVVTGESSTAHSSSKCIVHRDAALVVDFIDRS